LIETKNILGDDHDEENTGYVMLGDDEYEECSDIIEQQLEPSDKECGGEGDPQQGKNLCESETLLSTYDCVVVVHDPKSSKKEYEEICQFIKTLHGIEFEVKILFLDLKSPKIDEFNIEELFEKTESFIEVVADKIEKIVVTHPTDTDEKMDENGEWEEKLGFKRLKEALENCMWRFKEIDEKPTIKKEN
jgi:hypothetical protein